MVEKLEVAWTLAVVGLIAGVAVYSTILLYQLDVLPSHPSEYVDVIGHQWYWEFYYPANNSFFNSTYDPTTNTVSGGALWAPPGAVVQVNVTGAVARARHPRAPRRWRSPRGRRRGPSPWSGSRNHGRAP